VTCLRGQVAGLTPFRGQDGWRPCPPILPPRISIWRGNLLSMTPTVRARPRVPTARQTWTGPPRPKERDGPCRADRQRLGCHERCPPVFRSRVTAVIWCQRDSAQNCFHGDYDYKCRCEQSRGVRIPSAPFCGAYRAGNRYSTLLRRGLRRTSGIGEKFASWGFYAGQGVAR